MRRWLVVFGLVFAAAASQAAVKTQTVQYKDGKTVLEGYLAYDDSMQGKRPGVAIAHAWKGVDDHSRRSAERLAALGYTAMVIDIYGRGVRPADAKSAGETAAIYKNDRALTRRRAEAGLKALQAQPTVDGARVAAIGYCFGGMVALEMARAGQPLAAAVSFHGGLDSPSQADIGNFKGKILVLHGADDPYVKKEDLQALKDAMRAAKLDWQFIAYSGAVHAFTDPGAGNDPSTGAAYDERAARRAWDHMKLFFAEVLPAGR